MYSFFTTTLFSSIAQHIKAIKWSTVIWVSSSNSSSRRWAPPPGPRRRPTSTSASAFKPTPPSLAAGGRGYTPRPGLPAPPPIPPHRWPLHGHDRSPPRWTKCTAASRGPAAHPSTARPSCSAACLLVRGSAEGLSWTTRLGFAVIFYFLISFLRLHIQAG